MTVCLIGGTGFLGKRVAERMARQPDLQGSVRAMVRDPGRAARLQELGFELVQGDLTSVGSVRAALDGCDALAATPGLKLGHTPTLLRAVQGSAVERGVFVSTAGIFQSLELQIKTTVLHAEDLIRNSDLGYTILRPTMIYGTSDDVNIHKLIAFVARFGFFPVFGSDHHLQQPVHVEDVADAVVAALVSPAAVNRSYDLSGAAPLPFHQMLDTVGRVLGRSVRRLSVPLPVALTAARAFSLTPVRPFTVGQIMRNNEDKSLPHDVAARDLGFSPMDFEAGVRKQVAEMRAEGLIPQA